MEGPYVNGNGAESSPYFEIALGSPACAVKQHHNRVSTRINIVYVLPLWHRVYRVNNDAKAKFFNCDVNKKLFCFE